MNKALTILVALAGICFSYGGEIPPAQAATYTYILGDHPDGNKNPPYFYGLRLDQIAGSNDARSFFSVELNGASATLTYDDVAGTAEIAGVLWQNSGALWNVTFSMSKITDYGGGLFVALLEAGDGGSLTPQGGGAAIDLLPKERTSPIDYVFSLVAPGNDPLGDVRGGITTGSGWIQGSGTNDWLVTAVVPLPAALPLFGAALSLLGLLGWRRRQQA